MKVEINVPDGKRGNWEVQSFDVEKQELSQMISMFKTGRAVPEGRYKKLMRNGECIMSNTPDEICDFSRFVRNARGHVLLNGLGLGVVLKALLDREQVTYITVIEQSADVIALVSPTYSNKRVEIIHGDAFDYKPSKGVRYGAVWHDIWDNICGDNLPEMHKLHRKYGRRTDYQESWCRYQCEHARY